MKKPFKEQIKEFPPICTMIVEIVNSSTGSIALTIMFYVMMFKNGMIFFIEIFVVWVIWGFHVYNKISSKKLDRKEIVSITLLIIVYIIILFLFTCFSIKEFL